MTESRRLNGMELLPTEILFDIVKYLRIRETKTLSLVSKRMRDVCLPVLFRKVSIEFSTEGFDLLEGLLESSLHRYIVSFQYIVPKLLKPEIRNYEIFKAEILTPSEYVEECEYYDHVDSYEDWYEMEHFFGDNRSYTTVYKTIRRTCAQQQEVIEAGRDSTLMKLAFQRLSNLKELVLVFSEAQGGADWEGEYQDKYDMTEEKSYDYYIHLVLAALKGRSEPLQGIQLTSLEHSTDPTVESPHRDSLTILLTELVRHSSSLRIVESGSALGLLSRATLNIRELHLCMLFTSSAFVGSFLRSNAKSLRSLSVHDVELTDRNLDILTPAHVGDMVDLTIEREKWSDSSCSCSFGEGWRLFFNPDALISAPESRKRKRGAL